jgi:GTPase SAR1 family protein
MPSIVQPSEEIGKQLRHQDQSELLDAIDELTRRGLQKYVSLPQVIVCGDQSSGKSSVLEAISHVRFPTKDNLCTTFATELLVRRTPSNGAPVSIIPGASSNDHPEAKAKLERFATEHPQCEPEDLGVLVDAAKQAMKDASDATGNPFFDHTLRIQLCKPDWPPITIVDLPGLIHAENQDQTKNDVKLVRELVNKYMQNPRSIILAIVSAQSDAALQIVLSLAKDADPERKRTMGIITKPDTLELRGPESMGNFLRLARNESENHQFKLGWHVLKNRDPRSLSQSAKERDAAEKSFFSQSPWKTFEDQNCLGIDTLRLRLSRVLHERIASSLPDIIGEIRTQTAKAESDLAKLGSDRSSRQTKEVHLIGIAQSFRTLAQSAVEGTWSDLIDPFFKNPYGAEGYSKRLRAVVQNLNSQFSILMHSRGSQWKVMDDSDDASATSDPDGSTISANKALEDMSSGLDDYPGIHLFDESESVTREYLLRKTEALSERTRGRELSGVFNHDTIGEIFREQSQKWTRLAQHHVKTVWLAVKHFLEMAFEALADPRTFNAIMLDIIDPAMDVKKTQAEMKLEEILVPHTKLHPISYNSTLLRTMKELKYKRELAKAKSEADELMQSSKTKTFSEADMENIINIFLDSTSSTRVEPSDIFGCSDILDYMNAYYEVLIFNFFRIPLLMNISR